MQISFRISNTIHDLLKIRTHNTDPHTHCGMYQLQCHTCDRSCIGQTGCIVEQRYRGHVWYTPNDLQSACALHILQNEHEYGPQNTAIYRLCQLLRLYSVGGKLTF
jgi:hypothetical protein